MFKVKFLISIGIALLLSSCATLDYEAGIGLVAPAASPKWPCNSKRSLTGEGSNFLVYEEDNIRGFVRLEFENFQKSVAFAPLYIPIIPLPGIAEVKKYKFFLKSADTVKLSVSFAPRFFSLFANREKESSKIRQGKFLDLNGVFIKSGNVQIKPSKIITYDSTLGENKVIALPQQSIPLAERNSYSFVFDLSPKELIGKKLIIDMIEENGNKNPNFRREIEIKESEGYWFSDIIINC